MRFTPCWMLFTLVAAQDAGQGGLTESIGLLQLELHNTATKVAGRQKPIRVTIQDESLARPNPDVVSGRLNRFCKSVINRIGKARLRKLNISSDNERWLLFADDDADEDGFNEIFAAETDAEKTLDNEVKEGFDAVGQGGSLLQVKEKFGKVKQRYGHLVTFWDDVVDWGSGAVDTVTDVASDAVDTVSDAGESVWKDIERQARSTQFIVGPVNIHVTQGVSVEPKFELGLEGDNFALKAGFEDIRNGIHFGMDASIKVIFTTHGSSIRDLFNNIASHGCKLYNNAVSFQGQMVAWAMDLLGIDLSLNCYMESTVTVVAAGDSNKIGLALGWADKDGFHMLGGTYWYASNNLGFYVGWHHNNKYARFVLSVNEVTIDVVIKDMQYPNQCYDTPHWYDSDGSTYDCAWYAIGSNCRKYGHAYRNFGKTANEACCKCKQL